LLFALALEAGWVKTLGAAVPEDAGAADAPNMLLLVPEACPNRLLPPEPEPEPVPPKLKAILTRCSFEVVR